MSTLKDKLDAAIFQFHEKEHTFNKLKDELLVLKGSIEALAELVKAEESDAASVTKD